MKLNFSQANGFCPSAVALSPKTFGFAFILIWSMQGEMPVHDKWKLMSSLILCVNNFYTCLQTVFQSVLISMKDLREEKAGYGHTQLGFPRGSEWLQQPVTALPVSGWEQLCCYNCFLFCVLVWQDFFAEIRGSAFNFRHLTVNKFVR